VESAESSPQAVGQAKRFLLRNGTHHRLIVDLNGVALGDGLDLDDLLGSGDGLHGRHEPYMTRPKTDYIKFYQKILCPGITGATMGGFLKALRVAVGRLLRANFSLREESPFASIIPEIRIINHI
jgi:hypothetical protein